MEKVFYWGWWRRLSAGGGDWGGIKIRGAKRPEAGGGGGGTTGLDAARGFLAGSGPLVALQPLQRKG